MFCRKYCDIWFIPAQFVKNNMMHDFWILPKISLWPFSLLRNMSSVNKKTRQQMREQSGLVDSLVCYIKNSLEDGKAEDKVRSNEMELNSIVLVQPKDCVFICLCVLRGWKMQCVSWGTSPTSCTARCLQLLWCAWKDQLELRAQERATPLVAIHLRDRKPKMYAHVRFTHQHFVCMLGLLLCSQLIGCTFSWWTHYFQSLLMSTFLVNTTFKVVLWHDSLWRIPILLIGQFKCSPQRKNQDISTFTEVARVPKGAEWLWHPQIVSVYNRVLQDCEINSTTREAAAGALQNITAGDNRVRSIFILP